VDRRDKEPARLKCSWLAVLSNARCWAPKEEGKGGNVLQQAGPATARSFPGIGETFSLWKGNGTAECFVKNGTEESISLRVLERVGRAGGGREEAARPSAPWRVEPSARTGKEGIPYGGTGAQQIFIEVTIGVDTRRKCPGGQEAEAISQDYSLAPDMASPSSNGRRGIAS